MFPIAVPFGGNHRPLWMFYQHIDMETNKISQYSMYIYMAPAIVKLVAWLFITIGDGIHWTPVLFHSLYFELRKQSVVLYWTSWIVSWGQASGHGADDRMSSDRPSHWGTGVGTVWDIGKSSLCIPLFRGKDRQSIRSPQMFFQCWPHLGNECTRGSLKTPSSLVSQCQLKWRKGCKRSSPWMQTCGQ